MKTISNNRLTTLKMTTLSGVLLVITSLTACSGQDKSTAEQKNSKEAMAQKTEVVPSSKVENLGSDDTIKEQEMLDSETAKNASVKTTEIDTLNLDSERETAETIAMEALMMADEVGDSESIDEDIENENFETMTVDSK